MTTTFSWINGHTWIKKEFEGSTGKCASGAIRTVFECKHIAETRGEHLLLIHDKETAKTGSFCDEELKAFDNAEEIISCGDRPVSIFKIIDQGSDWNSHGVVILVGESDFGAAASLELAANVFSNGLDKDTFDIT
jgi:hypothetical protein